MVPIFECSPSAVSGISSSTTTYIMAPAAKARRYGRTGARTLYSSTVKSAATGSTTPESVPYRNARLLLIPSPLSGREMIAPSGKFWIAIPTDRANAPAKVIPLFAVRRPANMTPTAIPSGIL